MSNFSVYHMHYVLVKVTTDTGIVGYGEATPSWDVNGETPQSIDGFIKLLTNEKMLGYSLIGKNIATLPEIHTLIDTIINPIESFSYIAENTAAKAALEQALYSIYSTSSGISLPVALHIKRKSIPFVNTISIFPVKDTVEKAKRVIREGGQVIRLKIGKKGVFGLDNYQRDVECIKSISNIIGNKKIKLIADANQGFITVKETIAFAKQIGTRLDWLEQPTLSHNLLDFKELKKYCPIPIMADESVTSYKDLSTLIQMRALTHVNIKLMKTGGLRGALAFINLATRNDVKIHIGSMIESAYGIYMGLITALMSRAVISTDLNVYNLLNDQYCSYSFIHKKNTITTIDSAPQINHKKLKTIAKKYE